MSTVTKCKPGGAAILGCILSSLLMTAAAGESLSNLEVVWRTTFGVQYGDHPAGLVPTNDGGFVIVGTTNGLGSHLNADVLLAKVDSRGGLQWRTRFDYRNMFQFEEGIAVGQVSDGGFIAVGSTAHLSFAPETIDAYVVRTDGAGQLVWERTFGGGDAVFARGVYQTNDGGFLVIGSVHPHPPRPPYFSDIHLIKLDAKGANQWEKSLHREEQEQAFAAVGDPEGGYVIAGIVRPIGLEGGSNGVYLLKVDDEGRLLWERTFTVGRSPRARRVRAVRGGGFVLVGDTSGEALGEALVIRTHGDGTLIWQKTVGGTASFDAYDVIQSADDGFMIAGPAFDGELEQDGIFIAKLDALGGVEWREVLVAKFAQAARAIQLCEDGGFVLAGSAAVDEHTVGALMLKLKERPSDDDFIRGDANSDGQIDISDSIALLFDLFLGVPAPATCREVLDANDDGQVDISDPVSILGYLFLGGPALEPRKVICKK